ncbi:unnamed protein product, partial [Phaeothamnion confervicola]
MRKARRKPIPTPSPPGGPFSDVADAPSLKGDFHGEAQSPETVGASDPQW